ncbi:MAG TPA: NUDIX hydrolase [Gemmatimonadaceae bacterium]|nr:NUDIX hydrolase [Gemmatimonadaceae bacterium]
MHRNVKPERTGGVSSRRVYTGRVVSLDVDMVRFPDGSTGELEMIRHSGASAVVPFLDDPQSMDPRVVLIRQYRYAAQGHLFEIPAGRLDAGESPKACARRELKEETGYSAENLVAMTTFYTTPGFTDERIHLFAATGLSAGSAELEADEFVELHPTTLSEALSLISAGRIVDGKTMVGLMFAAAFIRRA